MSAAVRLLSSLFVCAGFAACEDVCPKAVKEQSGRSADLSWSSGTHRIGAEKVCSRRLINTGADGTPMAVAWPEAGILSAEIAGQFAASFCCSEEHELHKSVLKFGASGKTIETKIHAGVPDTGDDYPDLIEGEARTTRSSFVGKLWDGSRFIDVDIELRAAASHPHFNQSVFQFIIVDQSSEPVAVQWSLVEKLSKTLQPYTTDEGGSRRQTTYVFFGKDLPSPSRGVVEVKTPAGRLLGRFSAEGFASGK